MKKIIFALILFFLFPSVLYADWASPIVKQIPKAFTYNGLQYTVNITHSLSQPKAAQMLNAVKSIPLSKVAIPLRYLGWVGAAAGVGYLVYDMYSVLQHFKSTAYEMSISSGVAYACPYSSGQGGYSWVGVNSQSIQYGTYSTQGTFPRWNIYFLDVACSGIVRSYSGVAASDVRLYAEKVYMSQDCSVSLQTACSSAVPYTYTDTDVENWVARNPSPFSSLQPTVSSSKPVDAVEVEDPNTTATLDIDPQQSPSQEQQPDNREQQIPSPEEGKYIDPGVPEIPDFQTAFDVPEKKNIGDLLDRFLVAIPFLGALKQTEIRASGNCSFSIPTPFGTTGDIDFCRFDGVFSTIGGFIFTFASIYGVYIIFKRSD